MAIWIRAMVSPTAKRMVQIDASEEDLAILQQMLSHCVQTYIARPARFAVSAPHPPSRQETEYFEMVRERAYKWLGAIENAEHEAELRISRDLEG